jgi:trimethylamine--corrinoid protein Co-methyltransferase
MRSATPMVTGPDAQRLRLASRQMAAYVFGGTYVGAGGLNTTAKVPGAQSAMEKGMDAMWGFCAGVRSFASLGLLATSDAASVTQLMLDLEIVSQLRQLARAAVIDTDQLAEDVIREIAPTGAYFLSHEHTARHYRDELWVPDLMDCRVPMAWAQSPATMLENARNKAQRVAAEAENQCPLSDEQRRQVAEIMAEAQRKMSEQDPSTGCYCPRQNE